MSETGTQSLVEVRADAPSALRRWYEGVGRYEWLILVIASVGWIFDAYEGSDFQHHSP